MDSSFLMNFGERNQKSAVLGLGFPSFFNCTRRRYMLGKLVGIYCIKIQVLFGRFGLPLPFWPFFWAQQGRLLAARMPGKALFTLFGSEQGFCCFVSHASFPNSCCGEASQQEFVSLWSRKFRRQGCPEISLLDLGIQGCYLALFL